MSTTTTTPAGTVQKGPADGRLYWQNRIQGPRKAWADDPLVIAAFIRMADGLEARLAVMSAALADQGRRLAVMEAAVTRGEHIPAQCR